MAGNIKGITIEFNGDTTKLDKSLRGVDKQTKSIDKELRAVDKDLKFNPKSVELWQQKQQLLTQKIDATKSKLDLLKQAQKQMDADGVDKNSEQYRKLQREIIESESKLKNFEGQLRKIGNAKLTALGEQFKEFGKKATELGQTLSTKVTAPLAAIGALSAKKFAEVDKTMQLTNSTMGNTTEQADLLNDAMKKAAASSTYGMSDAATATLNFARAGLGAEEAAAALAPAMALAAGEGGNLDTVSGGLVATINGFHGSFDEAAAYADIFANACNNSALDVDSLSNAMSVAAPIFSAAGYTVQDAALYMGVMANNGIEADKAANSLKTGLARLIKPTNEASDWMTELGISVTNADGTMKDSVQVQAELAEAFSYLSESEQIAAASAIFGKNQMAPWLALINTAPSDVAALNTQLEATGTAIDMQASMMSGFGGSIEQLKSGIDVLATSFGEALAPLIQKVVGVIQKLVDWFNALSPQAQSTIAVIATVVAALGPVLLIVGALASSIGSVISLIGVIGPTIAAVLPVIAGISAGMLGAMGVIGALIAVGVLLYKNWDVIKAKAIDLKNKISAAWDNLKANTIAKFNEIKEKAIDMKNKIVSAWDSLKSNTVAKFNAIKDAIVGPFKTAIEFVKSGIERIKSIINGVKLALPKFKLPHFKISGGKLPWGIGGEGKAPSINVDWYKTGAIFDAPSVIGVGEAGREAVVPLSGEAMRPFAEAIATEMAGYMATLMALGNQRGGGSQTIHNVIELGGTKVAEQIFKLAEQGRTVMQG